MPRSGRRCGEWRRRACSRSRPPRSGVAALDELYAAGDLRPGETVVCAVTGHGLKAPDLVASLLA